MCLYCLYPLQNIIQVKTADWSSQYSNFMKKLNSYLKTKYFMNLSWTLEKEGINLISAFFKKKKVSHKQNMWHSLPIQCVSFAAEDNSNLVLIVTFKLMSQRNSGNILFSRSLCTICSVCQIIFETFFILPALSQNKRFDHEESILSQFVC